ncbi:glucooligosaccharide oxidase, partial [Pelomyxa schiedti]
MPCASTSFIGLASLVLFAAVVTCGTPAANTQVGACTYNEPCCVTLNPQEPLITLMWYIDIDKKELEVSATLENNQAPINGYLAVGAGDPDAGIFTGGPDDLWVIHPPNQTESTPGRVVDCHFSMMKIREDESQDVLPDAKIWQSNGGKDFGAHFRRNLFTGDQKDVALTDRDYEVLWAYREEPTHSNRGGMRPTSMSVHSSGINFFKYQHCTTGQGHSKTSPSVAPIVAASPVAKKIPTGKGTWISGTPTKFRLDWEVQPDGETIQFVMTGKTRGWVSFGWNPTSYSMRGCDKYTGWYTGGTGVLIDSYSRGHDTPSDDQSLGGTLDTTGATFSANSTHTIISFKRKLVTNDRYDHDVTNQTVSLLWALGENGGTMEWNPGNEPSYDEHQYYGGGGVRFLDEDLPPASNCTGGRGHGSYSNSDGSYILSWALSADNTSMVFDMVAKTTGWVSFGINEICSMGSADKVTGWVSGGALTILDTWATGYTVPSVDTSAGGTNDIQSATGTENSTHTHIRWTRLLDTGDAKDYKLYDHWYSLMWAVGTSDGTSPTSYSQHSTKGYGCQTVNFLGCSGAAPSTSTSTSTSLLTSTSQAVSVPCTSSGIGSWMSPNQAFILSWVVSPDKLSITFSMTGRTTGWVSMGLNSQCSMTSADKVVGWVDSGGALTIMDAYSTGYTVPPLDTSMGGTSDITATSGTQNTTHTTLTWTRNLITGDSYDVDITDSILSVMWAVGTADGNSPTDYSMHGSQSSGGYGCTQINFLSDCTSISYSSPASEPQQVSSAVIQSSSAACDISTANGMWEASNGMFTLIWAMTNDSTAMRFTMIGKTLGWISVGFNTRYAMDRADKYVGWVQSGVVTLLDASCKGRNIPDEDTSLGGTDDCLNVNGYENSTHTVISFTRLLDTGDSHDFTLTNTVIWLLWAWSSSDGISPTNYATHGMSSGTSYGGTQINLFSCSQQPPSSALFLFPVIQNPGQGLAATLALFIVLCSLVFWLKKGVGAGVPHKAVAPETLKASKDVEMEAVGASKKDKKKKKKAPSVEDAGSGCCSGGGFCNKRVYGMWSLGGIIVCVLYALLNIAWGVFWVWAWPTDWESKPAELLESAARVLGHMVSANMLIAVLPATRNSLLVVLLGESFERTVAFHRWLGRWTLFLLLSHVGLFLGSRGIDVIWSSGALVISQVFGAVGLLSCLGLNIFSLDILRRKVFNFFYYTHLFFIGPFFVFAGLHNEAFLPFAYAAAAIYGLDRIFRVVWGTIPRKATEVVSLPDGVMRVRWPKHPLRRYNAAQYIFLNFPQLDLFEWHPFTLSSAPRERQCEVNIKSLGNHTATLLKRASTLKNLWVRADGPYGCLQVQMKTYPIVVLIAGGIGVTPMMSIMRDIFGVIDANGDNIPGSSGRVQCVYFHWGIRSMEQYSWFSHDFEYIRTIVNNAGEGIGHGEGHCPALRLSFHVSGSISPAPDGSAVPEPS